MQEWQSANEWRLRPATNAVSQSQHRARRDDNRDYIPHDVRDDGRVPIPGHDYNDAHLLFLLRRRIRILMQEQRLPMIFSCLYFNEE
jgi:hypothetical protein